MYTISRTGEVLHSISLSMCNVEGGVYSTWSTVDPKDFHSPCVQEIYISLLSFLYDAKWLFREVLVFTQLQLSNLEYLLKFYAPGGSASHIISSAFHLGVMDLKEFDLCANCAVGESLRVLINTSNIQILQVLFTDKPYSKDYFINETLWKPLLAF